MAKLRLRELREEKNISQEELGKIMGVNRRTISSWECGVREPSIDTIEKLCKFFEVSAGYLLGIED